MAAVLTHARYDFPSLDELQQTYNEWLKKNERKNERKVEEVSFNNKTKELTLTYNDGTIERYIGAKVATTAQTDWGKGGQLEITYNFEDFSNDGKYVEDFGESNG